MPNEAYMMNNTGGSFNNMLGDPLEVSASAVDQLVQFEIEQFIDNLDEQKIQHERTKREDLKNLEMERKNMKLKL